MNAQEKMLAREKIRTQLSIYCRAIDQRDWDVVRACFGAEHRHHHGSYEGSLDGFIDFAKVTMQTVSLSHHSLANVIIELSDDGQSATSEANFTAVHLIKPEDDHAKRFDSGGGNTDWMLAGSYKDKWICRNEKWLIVERVGRHHWERLEPSTRQLTT